MDKSLKRLLFILTASGVLAIGAFAMTDNTWLEVGADTPSYTLTLDPTHNPVSATDPIGGVTIEAVTDLGNKIAIGLGFLSKPDPCPSTVLFSGTASASYIYCVSPLTGLTSITIKGFAPGGVSLDMTSFSFPSLGVRATNYSLDPVTVISLSYQKTGSTFDYNGTTVQSYQTTGAIAKPGNNYAYIDFKDTRPFFIESVIYTYACADLTPTVASASSSDGGTEQTTSHISGQPLSLP